MIKKELTWYNVSVTLAEKTADKLIFLNLDYLRIYGIPRGGMFAALAVVNALHLKNHHANLVRKPEEASIFVDDIIDTGKTKKLYEQKFPKIPFIALIDKKGFREPTWIVFPWEEATNEQGIEDNIIRILEFIGEDPNREGLRETPTRVIKSFAHLYGGYNQNPSEVIKAFEDETYNEIVLAKDIEVYSTCEHHMLPFYGKAHIAYIPNKLIIGISKLIRILEIFARRLQIQERLCQQITTALDDSLKPKGSACIIEAQHFCMTARGVSKQNSIIVTSSLTGSFKEVIETRNELMSMIGL